MANIVLDTNILVDALRGLENSESYLEGLNEENVYCSVVTAAELGAGVRSHEMEELDLFLSAFHLLPVNEEVARQAGLYMQKYAKSHGLLLPDALIAATAQSVKASLMTHNRKHFPMSDISVVAPY